MRAIIIKNFLQKLVIDFAEKIFNIQPFHDNVGQIREHKIRKIKNNTRNKLRDYGFLGFVSKEKKILTHVQQLTLQNYYVQ